MKTICSFVAAIGCFAVGAVSMNGQGGTGAVMKEARVTQIIKDVKLLSGQGDPRPASVSDRVHGDNAVRTGVDSRAELTFSDLTIARLGANTIFSFSEGSRTVDLGNGAILLRVPKGSGGAKVQTAAVTAAITGTTVIVEYHPKSYAKYLVLEGTMRIFLKGILGESVLMSAGQMMILNPNATRLSEPVDFDLERLLKTSLLVQGFRPLGSEPLMADAQNTQLTKKANGELIDTNLVIFGRGTLVTLTDPQSLDVVDRKIAAVTIPTPTPTATATVPPVPSPTPTATSTPNPTPTATPTATPKPSKFGTPPPILTSVPYPIDNGTVIKTDPTITRNGVEDFGKIYRDNAQDGPFSTWAFTATSPFDTTVGIDALYGPNAPVAAFKFGALQLVGDPVIDTSNGGELNLALLSIGPITSAPSGNAAFKFTGLRSVLLATQNGSIDITGPDITFQNIPLLIFYARGAGSNLTLGGMGIFNVSTLRLIAENDILISAPESLSNGANGGTLLGTAGRNVTVNSPIDTLTASVGPGLFSGAGGTVSLSALNGMISVSSRIQTSYNSAAGSTGPRSASGGVISLDSGLTTGTGITLSANSSLLSLLSATAPGPGGSITLTTAGSDIISNGATLQADRGTITIKQNGSAPSPASQITLNGGAIRSETLVIQSLRDLTIGTTVPVSLSAVTLSWLAFNNLNWSGGTSIESATNSPGNVIIESQGTLNLTGPVDIQRFGAGITDGLTITLNGLMNLKANSSINLLTDGSGLSKGGDIFLVSAGTVAIGGGVTLQTGPTTGDQASGSNITIRSSSTFTAADLLAEVQLGTGRTLSSGGNILMNVGSYTATQADGGLTLSIDNSAPGMIGTGGAISLLVQGNLATGSTGALNLLVDNRAGQIQSGGNINADISGNLTASSLTMQINNRLKGFIGTGAMLNLNVNGTLMVANDANFEILNALLGTPGGTIQSPASIRLMLRDTTIGHDFNAFIDNTDGTIGPTGNEGSVAIQIIGNLTVSNRIDVFGSLFATGTISAKELSGTNVNAPTITVGAGGITRFTFPGELTVNPLHTITATTSLMSTGGINFNGPDFDTPPGFGPFSGGQLTLNVPSLTFGPSAADNIQGPVTFNGGDTPTAAVAAGDGGTFTVNATGAITVSSPIEATTGRMPSSSEPSGAGGTVNLNSTGGTISVNSPITVSSGEPAAGVPRRHSRSGGNINLQSNATGVAINISNTGQLLSLLEPTAAGPGGKITILATAANSRINVTGDPGSAGKPPLPTIQADKGSIDIRNTGTGGLIGLTTATLSADIVKVGALGDNGNLTIGGGRINADTILKLYATGSNGSVIFISDVLLSGNSMKIIAGNSVTVNNNVTVSVSKQPAEVYVLDPAKANYSSFNGGNNSTNGKFIIEGSGSSPTSGANTHLGVAPPPFGVPGGP